MSEIIGDLLNISINPWTVSLLFAWGGGWVMMNAYLGRRTVKSEKFEPHEKHIISLLIGLVYEFLIFAPIIILLNFWILPFSADLFYISACLFVVAAGGVLFQLSYGKQKGKTFFQSKTKTIFSLAIFCFAASLVFVSSLSLGIFFYSGFTFPLLIYNWGRFALFAYLFFCAFCGGIVLQWMFILRIQSFDLWKTSIKDVFKLRGFRKVVAFMIILVAIGLLIPAIDANAALLTPKVTDYGPKYSSEINYGTNFIGTVFINSTRFGSNQMKSNYSSYILMERDYQVLVPTAHALQSIIIYNPSNVATSIEDRTSLTFQPILQTEMDKIAIDLPNGVTYDKLLKDPSDEYSDVLGIIINFTAFKGQSFWVNMTYWEELDLSQNLQVKDYQLTVKDLGNGTWMETHSFIIENCYNATLWLPNIKNDELQMYFVDKKSVILYINGNVQPSREVWNLRTLTIDYSLPAMKVTNLTYTFLDNQDPM